MFGLDMIDMNCQKTGYASNDCISQDLKRSWVVVKENEISVPRGSPKK